MPRRFNVVHIDLSALAHNLGQARKLTGPDKKIMAVVKADAYGHGLIPAAQTLVKAGADALGVMDLNEAVLLREAGLQVPIYILAGISPEQCPEILAHDITPFIYDPALARDLDRAARQAGRKAAVLLKVDTGMNRLGIRHDRLEPYFEAVAGLEYLDVQGLCTHLAVADEEGNPFTVEQIHRFEKAIQAAKTAGFKHLHLNSAANSAGVLAHPKAHFDLVRPGLMLYGAYPDSWLRVKADLRPVMSMTGQVIQVKTIPAGSTVSYGRTWTAEKETMVATAPLGYAHGFNRLFTNKGWGLIRGQKAPILGRVCMNLCVFDVSGIPGVQVGDEIVVLGAQGRETITGDTLAGLTGTISYETFCLLGGMNERDYQGEN